MKEEIKIVAMSDTHGHHRKVTVPEGDVLVFAGDFMTCGRRYSEVIDFGQWFSEQPHKHKILVAGNHDRLMESQLNKCLSEFHGVTYLQDSGCEIKGWKFWGSPWQPWFYNWAFNVNRGPDIMKYWNKIPMDTDVLVTHGPPYGIGDLTAPMYGSEHVGCSDLLNRLREVNPQLSIFGHIHNGRGLYPPDYSDPHQVKRITHCINASICDEEYEPVGSPYTWEWYPEGK